MIYAGVKVPAEDDKVNLKFSRTMSGDDFSKWLLSQGISEKDCNALMGMNTSSASYTVVSGVSAHVEGSK